MIGIFIFIFGLIVGSFLNVAILRLHTGESLVRSRSRCYSCGETLQWFDLIPVVSFIIRGGKCRLCKSKISPQYPLVELGTALIFYLSYLKWTAIGISVSGNYGILVWWFVFWALFLVLTVYDLYHKIIPDGLVYVLGITALGGVILFARDGIVSSVIIGVSFFLLFFLLWLVSKGRWMGLGDAKLFFGVGIFFGWPLGIMALFFSFWIGAILGSIVLVLKKSFALKSEIPFAPFVFLGALIVFLWGESILRWYLLTVV